MSPLPLGDPQAAITAGIGMVHQHFTLAENLTAFDNITLGAEPIFSFKRHKAKAEKKINDLMQKVAWLRRWMYYFRAHGG